MSAGHGSVFENVPAPTQHLATYTTQQQLTVAASIA